MHKIVPIILCLMLALPVHAEERFAGNPYAADILKAEAWLNQMKTLQTRFMQTDPGQGMVSQGTLTMSRPGNARWEYLEPTHILVLVTGKDVIYYDYELDQISYGDSTRWPTPSCLAGDYAGDDAGHARHQIRQAERVCWHWPIKSNNRTISSPR
ncbi:MAG: outer membrane lipoprotein carrier protein LolA [Hyphomicrobiales bacterium]|nr:outer membrane lipoprotein carrier protein LolA [Hyphomicrobiales bacterium]